MSEYIVDTFGIVQDFADLHGDMNTPLYQAIMDVMVSRQREEIVRCHDCKHLIAHGTGCAYWDYCDIESIDGFCAWGEPKVANSVARVANIETNETNEFREVPQF